MKKYFKYIFVTIVMFFLMSPVASADTNHQFSLKLYNCNKLNDDYVCADNDKNPIEPEELSTGDTIGAGKIIQAKLYYVPGSPTDISMQIAYFYNPDLVEPLYIDSQGTPDDPTDDEFFVETDMTTTYQGGIWPAKSAAGSGRNQTNWTVLYNNYVGGHEITHIIKDTVVAKPLETEGVIITEYFKVKEDATPGELIEFNFDNNYNTMANGSGITAINNNLIVYEEKDSDTTLSDISVMNGSTEYFTSTFNPTTKSYNVYVPNGVDTATVTGTPTKNTSTAVADSVGTLTVSQNKPVSILVTAQDGSTDTYTVNLYRLNNNADLSALALSGVDFGEFDSNTTTYSANVPYTTSSTTVSATAVDTKATVNGIGNKNLSVGANAVEVTVSPENCKSEYENVPGNTCTTKKYIVNVTRAAASTNANLSDLKVDGETVQGFDPDTLTYNLPNAAKTKSSITIAATAEDSEATVTGDTGNQSLDYGDNSFDIVVTAQDGTTKKTYTINIEREAPSNNAYLSDLKVDGTTVSGFDKETYTYTLEDVPNSKTSITIAATKEDNNATVTGDTGEQSLSVGNNTFEIEVTAENGTTKHKYTINVERKALSSNANLSDLKADGATVSGFNKDTTEYTLDPVASNIETITLSATAEDSNATVTGEGVQTLGYGNNSFDIEVTAENGTTKKKYTINVVRQKRDNAYLSDLKVDGDTVQGFNKDTLEYTLPSVAKTKTSIIIAATAEDSEATVTGDTGNQSLDYGDNSFDIVVTAHNGTTKKTYTINIEREAPSNNANLSDLKVDGETVQGFNKNTLEYTLSDVANEKDSITIAATKEDEGATVTGKTGVQSLSVGNNSFEIKVKAEDGTTEKTYTINVERLAPPASTNANLSDLKVDGETVSGFDKDTLTYTLDAVSNDKTSITIAATAEDSKATVTGDTGEQSLSVGNNSFEIKVKAEDGTTEKTYTINVERLAPPASDNANLSDLKVDGTTVSGFDKDTLTYTLDPVANSKTSITIAATAEDSKATVTGDTGEQSLNVGNNSFEIKVKAEDGTTEKTYTINVEREAAPAASDNAYLSDLKVDGETVSGFNKNTFEYTLPDASSDKDSITIVATKEDSKATVTGDVGEQSLTVGNNSFDIKVTAEDGTTIKTYTININKLADTNNDLSSLSVEGYTLDPAFDKDTTNYALEIPADVDSINITAEAASSKATVSGDGTVSIPESKIVTIKVTAEDGSEKTYSIVVTKGDNEPEEITSVEYGHTIADGMIKSVALGTKPNTLKDQLDNKNEYLQIWDKNSSSQIDSDNVLGTGMIVKLVMNDTVKDSKYIVVKGDVNGDGQIALLDGVKIINEYLEPGELEGSYLEAGDYDSNGQVALLDAVKVIGVYLDE